MQNKRKQLNWDDLLFFLALAENKTVSATAKILGVNYVTVSRRIDRLEEALNEKIFERQSDGYLLTIDGELLYQKSLLVRDGVDRVNNAFHHVSQYKKTIKLSMVHSLADGLVIESLAELQRNNPAIKLDIDTSTRNVSIVKREVDLALRLDLPESGECITRKLGDIDYILCGVPELVDKYNQGQEVPVISYSTELNYIPEAKYIRNHFGEKNIILQTNSATVQKTSAEAGVGLAMLPEFLLSQSSLQTINMLEPIKREVWLLVKKNIAQLSSVRLIIDNLIKVFHAT